MADATFADFAFDSTSPEAIRVANRIAADLVRQVSDETRAAIRQAIVTAIREGRPPLEAARGILGILRTDGTRTGGTAGLTRQQNLAVDNFDRRLKDAGLTDTPRAAARTKFVEKMLKDRAANISRTETMNALNAGQNEAWRQQQRNGLLGKNAQKEWIVTPDDRLCQICAPLDGETVPIGDDFSIGIANPPAHPRCRCAHGISDPFAGPKRETSIDVQERLAREGAPGAAPFDAAEFRERTGATAAPFFGATRRPPGGGS